MAINYKSRYPSQTGVDPVKYPYGEAENISSEFAEDGTPWEKDLINDHWGFLQSMLLSAQVEPNGLPDDASSSQYLQALKGVTLNTLGFSTLGEWVAGKEFTDRKQYAFYEKTPYQPKPSTTLPYTLTATPNLNDVQLVEISSQQSSGDILLSNYNITGTETDYDELVRAINDANATGKKVVGGRDLTIKLTGLGDIEVATCVDFGGATIDISEWGGKFIIENSEWVTYESGSPAFDNIVGTGTLSSDKVVGWVDLDELNNSYVKINSSNYYYTYRGVTINQNDFNFINNRGKLESRVLDLDTSNLTSVQVLPMPDKVLTFGNCTFVADTKLIGNSTILVTNSGRVSVQDITIKQHVDIVIQQNYNPTFIELFNSAKCTVDNIYFSSPLRADNSAKFNYGFEMEFCYDIELSRLQGYGEGWVINGNNESRRVQFKDCVVNCVDFHKPFIEYLKVINCQIGSWGIITTGIGDMLVDNCNFLNNRSEYFSQRSYFSVNDSCGGFWNGNVTVRNSSFTSTNGELMLLFLNKALDVGGIFEESNLEPYCWEKITIDNCNFGTHNKTYVMPSVEDDRGIRYPYSVTMRDLTGNIVVNRDYLKSLPRFDIRDDETDLVKPHNLFITLDNVEHVADEELFLMDRRDQNFKIKLHINNIKAINAQDTSGVTMSLIFGGDVSITNSLVEGFNFFNNNPYYKPLNIMISTSTINYTGRIYDEMFKDPAPRSSITASNCVFIGELNTVNGAARIKTVGCKMKLSSSPSFYDSITVTDTTALNIANGSSLFKATNTIVNWKQDVEVAISVATGAAYRVKVNLQDENINKTIPINNGYINILRSGGNVQVSNNVGAATNVYFYYVSKVL